MLTFTNNEKKSFNLVPYLHYPVYSPLIDESFYQKARVLPARNDRFDPDTLFLESTRMQTQ
jgi:hypothetical protein